MTEYKIGDRVPLIRATNRAMRDVMPNGEDIRSRTYSAHLANKFDNGYRGTKAFWNQIARKVECPECFAKSDEACMSLSVKTPAAKLKGVHHQRLSAAKKVMARK